LHFL